ncbi:hypothetical protein CVIRNUC_007933 [Coccomyxa viridis]|uniref:glycerophosphodiester phosphodiesterase n=1 Tax=Coccomyxa viridis TaxID=1274662 RepID=A0AAV1IFH0_9CHLO|nr:hypothetical protein CVIRNUC_007933 [Coccomyxa viridis]
MRSMGDARRTFILLSVALYVCSAISRKSTTIIAHRGSPCNFPEETLEGYQHAMSNGADYIEMDVVSTKDGALLLRHNLTLDDSTTIAEHPEFADRRWTRTLPDGRTQSGFFAVNYTLAELKTIYAKQAIAGRSQASDHGYRLRTLPEVLALAARSRSRGKPVGVYIEDKDPAFHESAGLPLEKKLVEALVSAGYKEDAGVAVILQSFEEQSLRKLSGLLEAEGMAGRAGLVWLLDCSANITDAQLDGFAAYGTGIGPEKSLVAPLVSAAECNRPAGAALCTAVASGQACTGRLASGASAARNGSASGAPLPAQRSVGLVQRAHQRGLLVHAYTFRNEERFMAVDFAGDPLAELTHYQQLGVDGVFVDCPSTAKEWLLATGQLSAGPSSWAGTIVSGPGPRASAAISAFSILVTLTVVALACGISACIKRRRRHRARYDLFPTDLFNTRDLNWYPPSDYRTAVVGNKGVADHEEDELPTSTAIMMTAIDSSPRAAEQQHKGPAGPPVNGS